MREEVIWSEALFCLSKVLAAYGTKQQDRYSSSLPSILSNIRFALSAIFVGIGRSLDSVSQSGDRALASPFETATRIVYHLANSEDHDADEPGFSPAIVLKTCDLYYRFLRQFSEEVKSADTGIVEAAAKSIDQICLLLLTRKSSHEFDGHQDDLQKTTSLLLNQLGWFAEYADEIKNPHSFDALVESAAKVGLHAVEKGETVIAMEAVKVLHWLATAYGKKTKERYYGLTTPRVMKRACFVGVLALKQKQMDVIRILKEKVTEIDATGKEQAEETLKASNESTKLSMYSVESEVGSLYDACTREKYNPNSLDNSSKRQLFAKIECSDIDAFCIEMWGFKASEDYHTRRI
jgi:hypothetical protein